MSSNQGGERERLHLNLQEVLAGVRGELLCNSCDSYGDEIFFTGVATDSRNVKEGFIFFPLVGTQDGHNYINQAVENGAKIIFVTDSFAQNNPLKIASLKEADLTVISVNHTMYALQNLATLYVSKFPDLIKIGITGSSGKTTTKEIAVNVLKQKYSVIYNEGNLNSETGLPLSVFNIRPSHQVGIFEMGMNRQGEISELASVLKPKYGIITNIGTAHIGILLSRQNIATEKREIFKFFDESCSGYVPEDDDFVDFLLSAKGKIKKYGFSMISEVSDNGLKGSSFVYDGVKMELPLCGKYNLKNALSVIALAKDLGLANEQIKNGIETVKPLFGRNQIIEKDYTIVQDCYNANPDSMAASIDFFSSVEWKTQKIFILGSMLELGSESGMEHEKIVRMALSSYEKGEVNFIVFFGKEMSDAARALGVDKNEQILCYISENTDEKAVNEVVSKLKQVLLKGDLILLKGSRGMALERIGEKLLNESKNGGQIK